MFEGGLEARKPIAEAMQEAKELGFEAIELAGASYDSYVTAELLPFEPGRPEKTAQAMKKIFK